MQPIEAVSMFEVDTGELIEAVAFLNRAVAPSASSTPELAGVALVTLPDELLLTVTDWDVTAVARIPAQTRGEDAAVVSSRLFGALVGTLRRGQRLSFTVADRRAGVTSGPAAWLLPTMPVEPYPTLPEVPPLLAEIEGEELSAAMAAVLPAAGQDPVLPKFHGVQVEIEGDLLWLAASDRYRLALAEVEVTPVGPNVEHRALVPLGIADSLAHAVEGPMRLHADDRRVTLVGETRTVSGRVSSAVFPAWRSFVGVPGPEWVAVERKEVERALRQVCVLGTFLVDLRAANGALTVTAAEDDTTATLPATLAPTAGDGFAARVRPRYLLDALAATGTDHVAIEPGPRRIVVAPADKAGDRLPGYRHIVMQLTGVPR